MKTLDTGLEKYRRNFSQWRSKLGDPYGFFEIPYKTYTLRAMVDDGETTGWEHVSVTIAGPKRPPNWEEMCFVKNLFWDEEETVAQFHPKKSEYVSYHANCLHLWKKRGEEFSLPPSILVGPKAGECVAFGDKVVAVLLADALSSGALGRPR